MGNEDDAVVRHQIRSIERVTSLSASVVKTELAIDEALNEIGSGNSYGINAAPAATVKAARLAALTSRAAGLREQLAATELQVALEDVREEIARFTTATDAGTKQLAKWTKAMAWATIVLAGFALAQVVVAVLAWLKPHP